MSAVGIEILTISLAVWMSETYRNPLLYFLAVVIIESRLHALGILMHEATHYRAFSNRRLNDTVGELLAWPVALMLQEYRSRHFTHHRKLNSEDDPNFVSKQGRTEFVFPQSPRALVLTLIQFAVGLKAYAEIKSVEIRSGINVRMALNLSRSRN